MTEIKMNSTKGKMEAFMKRLPAGLSKESISLLKREFIVNKKDFSFALQEVVGAEVKKAKQEACNE